MTKYILYLVFAFFAFVSVGEAQDKSIEEVNYSNFGTLYGRDPIFHLDDVEYEEYLEVKSEYNKLDYQRRIHARRIFGSLIWFAGSFTGHVLLSLHRDNMSVQNHVLGQFGLLFSTFGSFAVFKTNIDSLNDVRDRISIVNIRLRIFQNIANERFEESEQILYIPPKF